MALPVITVSCYTGGKVKVDVEGTTGSACKAHLDKFDALGKTTHEELKPEYFKSEPTKNLAAVHARRY